MMAKNICLEVEAWEPVMRAYLPKLFLREIKNREISEKDCKAAIIKAEKG